MHQIEFKEKINIKRNCNNFSNLPVREALLLRMKYHRCNESPDEMWVPIPGFKNYLISSAGRIKNMHSYGQRHRHRLIVGTIRQNKYFYVTLTNDYGKRVGRAIDRLMILSFKLIELKNIRRVIHLDLQVHNNKLENLDFVIWSESIPKTVVSKK